MGCQSSATVGYQNHQESQGKRNIKSGFKDNQRSKLLQAIQWNDPCDFAVAAQQNNIPIIGQLSQPGLFWMATHFSCRWNAFKVLDYILKTAYVQDPKNYIKFVNQQTVQGFSCLHLCAIWNAPQCLQILIKFGGVNLQIKDKTQTTPYLTAINYKRTQMRRILKEFQDLKISFLIVQHQKLSCGDILALQTVDTEKKGTNSKQFIPNLNAGLKGALGNLFLETQRQKQIIAEKQRLQTERQNIRLQLKKIEESEAKRQKQKQAKVQQEKKVKKQRQIKQDQKQLIEQMQIKQKQILKIKNNLNKIHQEKQASVLQEQKKKSQQFWQKNQKQLAQKRNAKNTMVSQIKESIIKIRNERNAQPSSAVDIQEQIKGNLPTQLKQIYQQAKKVGIFNDPSFPQSSSSIGNTPKAQKFVSQMIWLRPQQIFSGDYHLFDGIDPNDIKQGSLGVCYMLATLSTLAQFPDRIKQIFVFHDKSLGFYVLKMLIHGQIKFIAIDDAIPCNKSTKSPLFAKPNGNQLWVCLVEKAWAKCIGDYMKAQSMTPNHLMEDLTTCPSFGAWFKDKTEKTKDIDTHIKMKNIVVLTSLPDKKIQGIVNNHAYSLLNVYQHQGKNIYKIRNPWGKFEWSGQYNEKSPLWTGQLKKKVNFVQADDGIFFLSQGELLEAFVYYSISITRLNHKYSFVPVKTKKNENVFYTFQIGEDQQLNLRFVQKFNRMLADPNYKYSPVIFQVGKIQSTGQVNFLTQGDSACFWGGKSVHADPQILKLYSKGKYFIRIAVQWVDQEKYNSGVFSVFASKQLRITQLPKQQGQKYWVELMKNFALKKSPPVSKNNMDYIMIWMRGQLVCYSYAKQTQQSQNFQAKWVFDPSKFINCTFGLNCDRKGQIKYPIGKGKQKANVGTLNRTLINQSCTSGSVFISASSV